ncbi:hypothetical protein TIFTF001_027105 [Ficus carica]|uniref:CG-1 domain-containing protein n=1 Tax=Ficus carica TaxID=3494 RepID=A0AA88DMH2_FICCA|nr:hypothetical protein TIFTF001_027105 [Ficus carica]
MSSSTGFPGLLERTESNGMPPFQLSLSDKDNNQEFEGEISDVLNSALIKHDLPLARAWVPCVQNRKCQIGLLGLSRDYVCVLDVKCGYSEHISSHEVLACKSFHMKKGKRIVGKAFMTNLAFFSLYSAYSSLPVDPVCNITRQLRYPSATIAVPLRSSIHNSECVFEFFFHFRRTALEEQKKIVTTLFSTLKQCCRTLRVVADKVLEEPSNSTFLAFPSLQPFDTVEQSVAKDSLIQKENPREADPKWLMQLLPESSDQNGRCPDPTPRIEPAKTCDAVGLGFPGLLECSERNGMPSIQLRLSDKDNYQDFEANLNPRSSSLLLDVPALQHFDTVEPSVASDSLFPKENPREANPKHVMQLLPESSDQNEKCPDPRPRPEPAEMFAAIILGSLAANETNLGQILEEAQNRWLRPNEIYEILRNYQKFRLAPEPPVRPPAGSLFLFDQKALRYFRNDGHRWRKKKDGKTVKEAHEKLKAGSVDVLHCYYAHGEENENFQRRSYWMLDGQLEHIVLVHYREVKEVPCDNLVSSIVPFSSLTHHVFSSTSHDASLLSHDSAKSTGDYILKMKKSRVGIHLTRLCF